LTNFGKCNNVLTFVIQGNPTTIGGSGAPTTPRKKKLNSNVGAIAGGVGVVVLAAIVAAIFYFLAKKKRSRKFEPAFTQDTSNGGQTEEQAYFTGVQKAEFPRLLPNRERKLLLDKMKGMRSMERSSSQTRHWQSYQHRNNDRGYVLGFCFSMQGV
jgi:hypothetical protein